MPDWSTGGGNPTAVLFAQQFSHAVNGSEKQTEQEAVEEYCNKNGLGPERFMSEEYGKVLIIERKLVSPGDVQHGA